MVNDKAYFAACRYLVEMDRDADLARAALEEAIVGRPTKAKADSEGTAQQTVVELPRREWPYTERQKASRRRTVFGSGRRIIAQAKSKLFMGSGVYAAIRLFGDKSLSDVTWGMIVDGANNGDVYKKIYDYVVSRNRRPPSEECYVPEFLTERDIKELFPDEFEGAAA